MAARSTLTVTSGTTITSAWGNSVRDHLPTYTGSDDVATDGQLAFNTTSNRLVVRNSATTTPIAGAMPRARVTRSTSQTIATVTNTAISWDTQSYDTDSIWTVSPNPTRLTASHAGLWLVTYSLAFTALATSGIRAIWVEANSVRYTAEEITVASGVDTTFAGSAVIALAAAEYVELMVYHTHAGSAAAATSTSYLQMVFLGHT